MARFIYPGIQGPSGQSFILRGNYPDLAAFNAGAGATAGNPGDAWLLESDGSIMVYSTEDGWVDAGDIIGPQGIQGTRGLQGTSGTNGSQGTQGLTGTQGLLGIQGTNGLQGLQGTLGTSGTAGLETWTRYSPTFAATGLTFTGANGTYPTYNSYYVKSGKLVSFVIEVDCSTVTNFGTGQYKLQLPFTPAFGYNHFSGWVWADPNINPDTGTGHTILNVDHAGITDVLDLHYLKQSGGANSPIREGIFLQGDPVTLTTISKIYVNGTYISA